MKTSWKYLWRTSWRGLEDVLKTSWRHMAKTNILVLTKTSWRRKAKANIFVLIKTSWRRLEDAFWRRRRKTSSSRRMFAGLFISQFFELIKILVCFFSKINSPQKMLMSCLCLHHSTYMNGTSNVFTYLLIIFLERDWFRFFLNKWWCIRFTP